MAPNRTDTSVELSGPFFRADPAKRVAENIVDLLEYLADYGEKYVKGQIAGKAGRMPRYTGWTFDRIVGRVTSETGKKWWRNAVVSANTDGMGREDAIRTKAAAATIEKRWHPFRRAAYSTRGHVRKHDLTKGLN